MDLIPLQSDVLEFVQAGVSGFILKDASISEFFKTIRAVYEGDEILPHLTGSLFSQIIDDAINGSKHTVIQESVGMTKRERQVVALIADGSSNKEIAQTLYISIYTVKTHIHNIQEKLALHTRVQIVKHAHISDLNKTSIDNAP